jgi:hypothetical protein
MVSAIKSFSSRVAAPAALAAGAAWAADGVVQLIHPQTSSDTLVVGAAGYANLALFVAALLLVSPALVALGERPQTKLAWRAGLAAAAGTVLLGITGITSLAHGRDYSFFPAVAVLTNAAWLLGSIVIAVALTRTRTAPRWAARHPSSCSAARAQPWPPPPLPPDPYPRPRWRRRAPPPAAPSRSASFARCASD